MNPTEFRAMTRATLETTRLAAGRDLAIMRPAHVAKKYRVTRTTASRWQRAIASGGLDALRSHKGSGRPSMLSPDQLAWLRKILAAGGRIRYRELQLMIEEKTGVHYDVDYVGRLSVKLRSER